jgi:hypothetical protein
VNRFAADQLERFLRVVDAKLTRSARITLIGGSALALGYGVSSVTNDIDTFSSDLDDVHTAARLACEATGLDIPIDNSTVAQLPEGAEGRLRRLLPDLTRLEVYVVEAHDLAASKLLRGNDHDREQLRELHELHPLLPELLIARYQQLLEVFVGDPAEARWGLVHFFEEAWGELAGLDARRVVGLGGR